MPHIMHKNFRIVSLQLTLFATVLLSACSTVAPPSEPTKQSWQQRETSVSRLQNWHLTGKIGVQTARDSGSATLDWRQSNQQYTISLMGPLGSGAIKINGRPGSVSLEGPDGKHVTASNPEELLAQQWGWRLPVSDINYWIRGLPVPGVPHQSQYDRYQRLTSMSQQGWNVQYLAYTKVASMELPSKIALTSPDVKSKIIIYEWNVE